MSKNIDTLNIPFDIKNFNIAKKNSDSKLISDGGQLRWNWQFPQGGVNSGETEKETLFRELEEATDHNHFLCQFHRQSK